MSAITGFLTPAEAAEVIGVSYEQVTRYVNNELLPAQRVGRQMLIPEKAVKAFKRPPKGNPNFLEKSS